MNRALTLLFGSYLVALPAVATAQTTNEPPPVGGAPTATAATSAADIGTPNGTPPAIFKQGTMGLSFAVPNGGGTTIGVTYFQDANTALDLILGVSLVHTPAVALPMMASKTTFGFTIGGGYRMYKRHSAHISTYLEPAILISAADTSQFSSTLELSLAGAGGAEAMFTDWFSVRGQIGVGLDFSQKFKDIAFATATSGLFANFYWD
jgi:hypothetical protein